MSEIRDLDENQPPGNWMTLCGMDGSGREMRRVWLVERVDLVHPTGSGAGRAPARSARTPVTRGGGGGGAE